MAGLPWNTRTWAQIANRRFGMHHPIPGDPVPYTPPTAAPPGTYDPSLDFQGEQTQLGFSYAGPDAARGHERNQADYFGAVDQARTRHTSNLGALGTALERANTDYGTQTRDLGQSYQRLGSQQTQRANAAGVSQGGAAAQSARKRAANQGQDQSRLDQAIARFREDNARQVGQENQSWQSLVGADEQGGSLGQAYNRGNEDIDRGYDRTFGENVLFGDQLDRAKIYSAQQAGLLPTRPQGTYATLPPGASDYLFGGVQYGPSGESGNPFLAPQTRPSAASVLATGSLLGTRLDPRRYRRLR